MKIIKSILTGMLALLLASAPASATIYDWSQTPASNGNSDAVINFLEGQAPSTVNDSARALMSVIAKWRDDTDRLLNTTAGSANAQTVTSNGSSTSLVNGWRVCFVVGSGLTNSGATTLNVDALGAKNVVSDISGTALVGGELVANQPKCVIYKSSITSWVLQNYLTVGGGLEYTTGGGIRRSALTGPVTAPAGSNATTITAGAVGTTQLADASVTAAKLAASALTGNMPVGEVFDFAGGTCPAQSVAAEGGAISRTTYSALFAITGTTYGAGDGSTTFNVPDIRGRFIAGFDSGNATGRLTAASGGGTSAAGLGNTGGTQNHTMSTAEMVAHNHTQQGTFGSGGESAGHTHTQQGTFTDSSSGSHSHTYTSPTTNNSRASGSAGVDQGTTSSSTSTDGAHTHNVTISGQTGGESVAHTHSTTISGVTTTTGSTTAFNITPPSIILKKCIYTGV